MSIYQVLYYMYVMVFFIVCEWLYNMNLCMRVIMYIINLFLCCVCFVIIWYVCVTTVISFLNVYNKHTNAQSQVTSYYRYTS